ncbi:MAG: biotin synthase BioB [Burkholderiales bacterium]|nr:biotin synthase BioB [Burkholderiales bacterium]
MVTKETISEIYNKPLLALITDARVIHQTNFPVDDIELCHLVSVKTGGCPEDCKYCSQSIYNKSPIKLNPLLPVSEIEEAVTKAKSHGVKRICLGAAYRTPNSSAIDKISQYIQIIKKHGLESCATLGSLNMEQAEQLKSAGLDYYNHNIDTSPEFYPEVITTRTFNDRIDTISNVANVGMKVCCGGIMGLGESRDDRVSFIHALYQLPAIPDSIPINMLVKVDGAKLNNTTPFDKNELVRMIATVRILFPKTRIRLSAGRNELSKLEQSLLFLSGANSIFFGDKLLTVENNEANSDLEMIKNLV